TRIGRSGSSEEPSASFVGTIIGKSILRRQSRRRWTASLARYVVTDAGSRCGVWSTGADASRPWNVWPTTAAIIAPLSTRRIAVVAFFTSAEPNRFASFCAADFAPDVRGSKYTVVRKKSKLGAFAGSPFGG